MTASGTTRPNVDEAPASSPQPRRPGPSPGVPHAPAEPGAARRRVTGRDRLPVLSTRRRSLPAAVAGPTALCVTLRPRTNLGCAAHAATPPHPARPARRKSSPERSRGPARRAVAGSSVASWALPRRGGAPVAVSGGRTTRRPRRRMRRAGPAAATTRSFAPSLRSEGPKSVPERPPRWGARARRKGRRPGSRSGRRGLVTRETPRSGRFARRATTARRGPPRVRLPGRASSCNAGRAPGRRRRLSSAPGRVSRRGRSRREGSRAVRGARSRFAAPRARTRPARAAEELLE